MHRELDKALRRASTCCRRRTSPRATGHIPEMLELITELIGRGHAYAAEDGSGDVYFDVRSWPAYGELTHQGVDDMEPAERRRPARASATRATSRSGRAGRRSPSPRPPRGRRPWGPGRPGWHIECSAMARQVPRPRVRHPRRRRRPALPAPRERAGPVPRGRAPVRVVLDAQRLDHHRRREDEQVARQLAADPGGARAGPRRSSCASTSWPRTTARHVEFSFEALDEAAAGFRRIENFLDARRDGSPRRAADDRAGRPRCRSDAFVAAMDDDLGTPAAVAVIHDTVREGNKLLADGASAGLRPRVRQVFGDARRARPRPRRPRLGLGRRLRRTRLSDAVDALVRGLLDAARRGPRRQGLGPSRRDPRPDQGCRASRSRTPRPAPSGPCPTTEPQNRSTDVPEFETLAALAQHERHFVPVTRPDGAPSARPARSRPPAPEGASSGVSRARGRRPRPRTARTTRSTSRTPRPSKAAAARPRRRTDRHRGRVDRGPQLRGRGAAGRRTRDQRVRRRGRRTRRPAARDVPDRQPSVASGCSRSPRTSSTG